MSITINTDYHKCRLCFVLKVQDQFRMYLGWPMLSYPYLSILKISLDVFRINLGSMISPQRVTSKKLVLLDVFWINEGSTIAHWISIFRKCFLLDEFGITFAILLFSYCYIDPIFWGNELLGCNRAWPFQEIAKKEQT